MLTPFAKLILAVIFVVALIALVIMRLVKWFRGRSAAQPQSLKRYDAETSLAAERREADRLMRDSGVSSMTADNRSSQQPAVKKSIVKRPIVQKPDAPAPVQLEADVPLAKPLDSSSILVGGKSDSATRLARTSAANETYLRDVPKLPEIDPADIPVHGTADYRYGETATRSLAAMLPETPGKKTLLKKELVNAGEYAPHAYDNFRASRAIGVFGAILLCLLALVLVPQRFEGIVIAALVVLPLVFWALPTVLMRGKAAERRRQIENGMPDMLDLLSMCVSQGMTVPSALGRVSTELKPVYPALSQELKITGEQAKIGSLEASMAGLGRRVDIPEMHSFTSLMSQTERMGTSVSESLEVYSDNIRESLKQRADQKANTAGFKLLFPTVLFLMPAVFLFLLGPALIDITDFFNSGASNVLETNSPNAFTGLRVEQ